MQLGGLRISSFPSPCQRLPFLLKHAVAKDVELSLLCALLDPMELDMAGIAGTGCVETCSISLDLGSHVHHCSSTSRFWISQIYIHDSFARRVAVGKSWFISSFYPREEDERRWFQKPDHRIFSDLLFFWIIWLVCVHGCPGANRNSVPNMVPVCVSVL